MRLKYWIKVISTISLSVIIFACNSSGSNNELYESIDTTNCIPSDTIVPVPMNIPRPISKHDTLIPVCFDTAEVTEAFSFRKRDTIREYTPEQLLGHWAQGTLHECYDTDSTGHTWDTQDDVLESEAQTFHWRMIQNRLMIVHMISPNGIVPRDYTIVYLSDKALIYEDTYGTRYQWHKIK